MNILGISPHLKYQFLCKMFNFIVNMILSYMLTIKKDFLILFLVDYYRFEIQKIFSKTVVKGISLKLKARNRILI